MTEPSTGIFAGIGAIFMAITGWIFKRQIGRIDGLDTRVDTLERTHIGKEDLIVVTDRLTATITDFHRETQAEFREIRRKL